MARCVQWAGLWLASAAMAAALASTALAAEPPNEPMLRIEAGMHTASIGSMATDAKGQYAVTSGADKTIRVWEVRTGRLLRVLRHPIGAGLEGRVFALDVSPDASVVAVGGFTKLGSESGFAIYLIELATGRLWHRLTGLSGVISSARFSPDGRWLAATLGGKGEGVRVWNWRERSAPMSDTNYGDFTGGLSWSNDGRLVVASRDGKVRLYRSMSASTPSRLVKELEVVAPSGQRPDKAELDPSGQRIAVVYADSKRVDVLDGQSLALLYSPDTTDISNGAVTEVAWSADGQMLVAGGSFGRNQRMLIRAWANAGQGQPKDYASSTNTVQRIVTLPQGGWLVASSDPAWGVFTAGLEWSSRGVSPVPDFRGSHGISFLVSASGKQVEFRFEGVGKAPYRFLVPDRMLQGGMVESASVPITDKLPIQNWMNRRDPALSNAPLKLLIGELSRSLAISPDASAFVLGTSARLISFDSGGSLLWANDLSSEVLGVNIPQDGSPRGRLVVSANQDGTIRWHRLSDGKEVLALFLHADRSRWVLWTPSGYYDASPGGEDLIGWHLNRGADQAADFFPASRFRDRFRRPDIIDRVLDTLDEDRAIAQANEARGQRQAAAEVAIAQVLPPVVDVLSGTEVQSSNSQITLRVRGRSTADAPVTGWRVRVNGQAVEDARGLGRQDAVPGERELTVAVPASDSEVQVFAENRFGVSAPALVRVKWVGVAQATTAPPSGFVIQPKLYVLAVGVGAYQNAAISKLTFPAKDARDFAAAMTRQKGRLYREVEVKLLTEAEATADAVVDGLDWLKRQVTQHDVGAVFIAGHGVNDHDVGGYAYLPANADPARLRRTSVSMDEFKRTLSRLPGKALFFFDTCHSGNVLGAASGLAARSGPNDVSGVINELASAENGVVVFSSSTGRQLSYENTAWANGAFTKAVVEGLDGAADFQKSGRITHKMLDLYISERVKALTKGLQSPVTQAPGGVPDFPVAASR